MSLLVVRLLKIVCNNRTIIWYQFCSSVIDHIHARMHTHAQMLHWQQVKKNFFHRKRIKSHQAELCLVTRVHPVHRFFVYFADGT